MPSHVAPTRIDRDQLVVRLTLTRLDDLFETPSTSPMDPDYGAHGGRPALVYATEVLAAERRRRPVHLEIALPGAEPSDERDGVSGDPAIGDGVRRWARTEQALSRRTLDADRRFGARALLAGVVLLVVLVTCSRWLELADDELSVPWILSQGLLIGAWVSLWTPLDHLIFGFWRQRSDAAAYELLGDATVSVVDSTAG